MQTATPKFSQTGLFTSLTITTVCVLFFLFQPRVNVVFFSAIRSARRNAFFQRVQKKRDINPQEFWQFREFMGSGSFTFNPDAAKIANGLILKPTNNQSRIWLLSYTSPYIVSWDGIVQKSQWQSYLFPLKLSLQQKILFQNPTTLIYQESPQKIKIIFIKPIEEMMIANGFFSYTNKEKTELTNYFWLDETWVYTN